MKAAEKTPGKAPSSPRKTVRVGPYTIGKRRELFLIAGPCVIESDEMAVRHAKKLQLIARELGMPLIFKSSYDKANRSSADSFRGPGLKAGLDILSVVKREVGVPVLSDVHSCAEIEAAAGVLDVLQIPAFLCRQTDLIMEAARTQRVVNVKKGQFLAPEDMGHVIEKIRRVGNEKILLTERGASFGYHALVTDFRSIVIMKRFGYPVIFDATHSVQQPGGLGNATGGEREFVAPLARAAVAVGCDGLFLEVHERPGKALSDGPNMVPLSGLKRLLRGLKALDKAAKHVD